MQIDRLFGIVYLLLNKKSVTARELAERFEVSRRTILRDVDTLAAAGIPIYTAQGRGGGISLLDGFVLNKTVLTDEEQNQILLALQSLPAAGNMNTGSIITKLGALFRKAEPDWIEVDFSRWGQGESEDARFGLLKQAVLSRTAIQFEYVSSQGGRSERVVYPLKLVFKSRAWYLQGFCLKRQGYRTFKINRMLEVSLGAERFEEGKYFPPPLEDAKAPVSSLISIELEFAGCVAYRVYDEFDEGCIETGDNGSLHVFARLPEDEWLYGFLLSLGKNVTVLQPQSVKERLLKINK